MAQDYSQVNFRIPTKLKEQIEQSSLTNNRSITAELVSRLEKSFTEQEAVSLADLQKEMRRLSTEAREMRMLYIEAITGKNKLLEGLTLEDIQHILEAKLKQKDLQ